LINVDTQKLTNEVYGQSKLTTYNGVKELLNGDSKTVITNLNNDKGYQLIKEIADKFLNEVAPKYEELNLKITALQRTYMKAQLELANGARMFPDANSTLRLTYGKVKGYSPKDAITYSEKPIWKE